VLAEQADTVATYQPGIPKGFFIVDHFSTPSDGFDMDSLAQILGLSEIERLKLTPTNVTLPVALMLMDPETYPSLSRARKTCRKGYVLIHRGRLSDQDIFEPAKCIRGRVGDRVFAGDVIAQQVRVGNGWYNAQYHEKPPFELPVVYEDDHFAIVNKPAGVITYAARSSGHGRMSVRAALPFCVKAPKAGTFSIISRPIACHRLDKATSGLLVVAKTKPAMVHLTRQFAERKVKKTYTAIVNGVPAEDSKTSITPRDAYNLGVDVDSREQDSWQLIDHTLDEKHAITVWRTLRYVKSLKARDGVLTLVELKPKTGRYHQLRRHMAWNRDCALVGDKTYDDGKPESMAFRKRGLFLCSNHVTLEHPYYNSVLGRKEWDSMDKDTKCDGMVSQDGDGTVRVTASIALPEKFESFLSHEEARSLKFEEESQLNSTAA
jgi:23S rRNA-/tRNA-specific pseudouridylate synthase